MSNADVDTDAITDLFPRAHDCLPRPFSGEALYSWCARYHRLNGGNNPRATSRLLFGHPTAGLLPDHPYRLGKFQENTRQHLGPLDDLLRQRTVFGFFAPFLPPKDISAVSQYLSTGNSIGARALLGVSKDGQATRSPLRFCPECIKEQLAGFAISWWQVQHLWPSVCVCQLHGCLLVHVRDELFVRASADYFLAHELGASHLNLPAESTPQQRKLLGSLASWTKTLASHPDGRFIEAALRITYLMQAKKQGWLALDGSLRLKVFQDSFVSQSAALGSFSAFKFVADANGANGGFIGTLVRQYPGRRHPSKHIVMMNFLFAEQEEFLATYAGVEAVIAQDGIQGAQKLLTNTSRQLVRLIEQSSLSVSAAAERLDIPAAQALSHLNSKVSVARPRRPHIVGTAREHQLREMLGEGRSRSEIAESLSLRPAFIKDYLAQYPELKAQWAVAHAAQETGKHRAQFLAALNANPRLPIKSIRRLPKNGFQWLYNNDREWLQEVLPAIWKR